MDFRNPEKKSLLVLISVILLFACAVFINALITGFTVTAPNGGENWKGHQNITWTEVGDNSTVDIVYTTNNWDTSTLITEGIAAGILFYEWNTNLVSDSSDYIIKVYRTGNLGVYDTSNTNFTVDNTGPTPSNIDQNDSTPQVDDNVTFYTLWTDSLSGTNYSIFSWNNTGDWVNQTEPGMLGGSSSWSNITGTIIATGKPTLGWIIYANDSAGNWNNTGIQTFTVANTAPTQPTLTNPADGAYVNSITMNWSASTDADLDTLNYYVIVNGTEACYTTDLNCSYAAPSDAYYEWNVTPFDDEENGTTSASRYYTYDTTNPSLSITTANNSVNNTPVTVIEGTASDTNVDTIYSNNTDWTWNATYTSWNFTNATSVAEG
ncbi:MAG: hypothetical protein ABIC04_08995, partial [Nanoarchaeota archaeon]